jgi:hypothetical protein
MITLPPDWIESERGNTLLTNDDEFVAWIKLPGDEMMLEVTYSPGNSPSLYVTLSKWKPKATRKHVLDNLAGWFVRRWNLDNDPPIDAHDCVVKKPKRKALEKAGVKVMTKINKVLRKTEWKE